MRTQGAYFEGDRGVIVLRTMFLVSSVNASIFHVIWLDTFWRDLVDSKSRQIGKGDMSHPFNSAVPSPVK